MTGTPVASIQRLYQKRNFAAGKCIQCPLPSIPKKGRCFRHQLFYKLRQYGMAKGFVSDRVSNKREKLAAHLFGRYHAVASGFLNPGDENQRIKDAIEIRIRLNIKWGGVRGSKKFARILKSFDRVALQIWKEKQGERIESNPTP